MFFLKSFQISENPFGYPKVFSDMLWRVASVYTSIAKCVLNQGSSCLTVRGSIEINKMSNTFFKILEEMHNEERNFPFLSDYGCKWCILTTKIYLKLKGTTTHTKARFFNLNVKSVLFYGVETWRSRKEGGYRYRQKYKPSSILASEELRKSSGQIYTVNNVDLKLWQRTNQHPASWRLHHRSGTLREKQQVHLQD